MDVLKIKEILCNRLVKPEEGHKPPIPIQRNSQSVGFKNNDNPNSKSKQNIQSVIIEGGRKTILSFFQKKMWDEARIFTSNINLNKGIKAPLIKGKIISSQNIQEDYLKIVFND